jgi:hypothetical protein
MAAPAHWEWLTHSPDVPIMAVVHPLPEGFLVAIHHDDNDGGVPGPLLGSRLKGIKMSELAIGSGETVEEAFLIAMKKGESVLQKTEVPGKRLKRRHSRRDT